MKRFETFKYIFRFFIIPAIEILKKPSQEGTSYCLAFSWLKYRVSIRIFTKKYKQEDNE